MLPFARVRLSLLLLLLTACADPIYADEPETALVDEVRFHLDPYEQAIDLLLVLDDSPAMAPYADNAAALLPEAIARFGQNWGQSSSLRIAVTTADPVERGALRDGTVLGLDRNFDGSRATTFSGSLADAVAPLVATGAAGGAYPAYFDAAVAALGHFHRPNAHVFIDLVGAADDASHDPDGDAFELRALTLHDPGVSPLFTSIHGEPDTRTWAFISRFPTFDSERIDGQNFGGLSLVGLPWDPFPENPCFDSPLAIPYDCDASFVFPDGSTQHVPTCATAGPPCWELLEGTPMCPGDLHEVSIHRWDEGLPAGTQVVAQCAVTP